MIFRSFHFLSEMVWLCYVLPTWVSPNIGKRHGSTSSTDIRCESGLRQTVKGFVKQWLQGGAFPVMFVGLQSHEYYRYITNKNHSHWSYLHQQGLPQMVEFVGSNPPTAKKISHTHFNDNTNIAKLRDHVDQKNRQSNSWWSLDLGEITGNC